ncbi:MAG TPA: murein biosynthesis integral membrane protein MurJ [Longimicrobiales bacterium]|nr:murein biosynthesis integral membrane protein MurJ [Longimicrobiales bacterium]
MTERTDPPPAPGEDGRRDARAAARVGAGIFLSKAAGFIRERVTAYYFGTSGFADAWRVALRMPNVLQNLLGEGTLSASFIPVYAEFLEEGRDEEAGRFAGATLGILVVVAGALVLAGILIAPWLVAVLFLKWSPEKQALTVQLIRILFPMTGILVVSAWALGVLNSHRRFFVSYVAPVFWNLAQITALVAGGVYFGLGERDLVVVLAWGALVGGALQFGVQLPFMARHLRFFRLSLGKGVTGVPEAIRNFGPVVAGRGVVNLSGWVDLVLAGMLAEGAVAAMGYAQTFYMLPISLFGLSVAASELPELSRMRQHDKEVLATRVAGALRRVSYFLIPSAVGYLFLGDVVVGALYQTGAFGSAQTLVTWGVLAAYALGLTASARSRVLSSAYYAVRDTRTPALVATLRVVVSAGVGLSLMFPLDTLGFQRIHMGAAGLALGASVGAWLEYGLLRRALTARIGPHGPPTSDLLRMTLAAAVAAAAGVGLQVAFPVASPVAQALETLVPFGVVYVSVAAALGLGLPGARRSTA